MWYEDSSGPKEPCIRQGLDPSTGRETFDEMSTPQKNTAIVSYIRTAERLCLRNISTESSWPRQHKGVVR